MTISGKFLVCDYKNNTSSRIFESTKIKNILNLRTYLIRQRNRHTKIFDTKFLVPYPIFINSVWFLIRTFVLSIGQRYPWRNIFVTKSDFRRFCPTNLCPVRYAQKTEEFTYFCLLPVMRGYRSLKAQRNMKI